MISAPEGSVPNRRSLLELVVGEGLDPRQKGWTRRHDGVPLWVAAQTPWILVKPMWQVAQ